MASTKLTTEEAQKHVRALSLEITKLNKELTGMRKNTSLTSSQMSEKYNKIKYSIAVADKKLSSYNKKLGDLSKKEKKAASNTSKTNKQIKQQGKEFNKTNRKVSKFNRNIKKTGTGVKGLIINFKKLLSAVGLIVGIQMFVNIIRNTGKLILQLDSLKFALQTITADTWEYAQSQQFMMELNRKFGSDLVNTTERWVNFRAAAIQSNLTLLETEKIFRSMTKTAAVLGKSTDELRSIYLALEQMLSKGKVTTEELRRQLGERLPGAVGIMAASIGKTIPELDKMLQKGELLSAEVLPGFADAVEVAFGIESVRKVDTLRSRLGRITGSWQLLVKEISEGESIVSDVFAYLADGLEERINELRYFLSSDIQKMNIDVELSTDDASGVIEKQAIANIEAVDNEKDVIKKLREEIIDNEAAYQNTLDKEKRIALKKRNDEVIREIVLYSKRVGKEEKKIAGDGYQDLKKELSKEKALYEKNKEEIAALYEEAGGTMELFWDNVKQKFFGGPVNLDTTDELNNLNRIKDSRYDNIVAMQAEYDIRRKLLEVQPDIIIEEEKPTGRLRKLEKIRDLEKDVQREIAKTILEGQESALANEDLGFQERLALLRKYHGTKNRISELSFEIEIDKIKATEKSKLKILNEPAGKNEKIHSQARIAEQRVAIEKEANDKIKMAYQKHQSDLISIGSESAGKINSATEDATEAALKVLQSSYDKQIIAIKKKYSESKKTNSDLIIMEEELAYVAVKAANASIDAQIRVLKAKLAVKDINEEIADQLRAQIAALEANRPVLTPPDSSEKWADYFESILEYAGEFNQALGGLVDNLYSRRLENINAEIEAEEDKYDRLIDLAKNDDKEKEVLERNKEIRTKQLEKKRLQEEQKQAKARKAFALADIQINTAAAIMSIWYQVPKFDFGVSAAAMTAFVAGLGALQTAAVLAQPIPKYKDGGTIKKDELGIINDGAFKEYLERDGNIMSTDKKNAKVDLRKDDVIYKNYGELAKQSRTYKGLTGGESISENDFNKFFNGIDSSIIKGFKKAKINNNVTVVNKTNNDSYAEKMSRWNG